MKPKMVPIKDADADDTKTYIKRVGKKHTMKNAFRNIPKVIGKE